MRMAGTFRPRNAVMQGRTGTMQAYGRVGATDDGAHPARHRGDATHGRDGRDQRSGSKQAKVALSGRKMVPIRQRVALVRRRTAPSRCMVAPARRIDAAMGNKCPGDASAWSRWRDERWGHPSGWHGHTDAWLAASSGARTGSGTVGGAGVGAGRRLMAVTTACRKSKADPMAKHAPGNPRARRCHKPFGS
jgi:hypothetical protein